MHLLQGINLHILMLIIPRSTINCLCACVPLLIAVLLTMQWPLTESTFCVKIGRLTCCGVRDLRHHYDVIWPGKLGHCRVVVHVGHHFLTQRIITA
jgi:hypothetical protein